jgi:hypothetical protein
MCTRACLSDPAWPCLLLSRSNASIDHSVGSRVGSEIASADLGYSVLIEVVRRGWLSRRGIAVAGTINRTGKTQKEREREDGERRDRRKRVSLTLK